MGKWMKENRGRKEGRSRNKRKKRKRGRRMEGMRRTTTMREKEKGETMRRRNRRTRGGREKRKRKREGERRKKRTWQRKKGGGMMLKIVNEEGREELASYLAQPHPHNAPGIRVGHTRLALCTSRPRSCPTVLSMTSASGPGSSARSRGDPAGASPATRRAAQSWR